MKHRQIRRQPILREKIEDAPLNMERMAPTNAPLEEKKENLYRAIERTQAYMHKKQDPQAVMDDIRRYFPAPKFFLESKRQAMTRTRLTNLDTYYYAMIPSLTRTTLSQQWGVRPQLHTLTRMAAFLRTLFLGVHEERFYLVMLNRQGKLIRAALLQKGDVDNAPFYLKQLLETVMMESAQFIVLAHNHPRGTRRPSKEDLYCTLKTLYAVSSLGVPLLDHIIIVKDGAVSIRESGLIPAILWTTGAGKKAIVHNWLDGETLTD